jgi:hypothetical protein
MISKRKSTIALAGIALAAMFSIASPVQAQDAPKVKLATSMGDIVVQLDPAKAPKTVENFLTPTRPPRSSSSTSKTTPCSMPPSLTATVMPCSAR